jgi:hypothetical protein
VPRDLTGFVEHLAGARIGSTFNFYRDGTGARVRRARLVAYLDEHRGANVLLVGEAAGYRGARVSGLPFTSERQLTGSGLAEASATPTRAEIAAARPFLEELTAGRYVLAVGRLAARELGAPYVRHPARGGGAAFRAGLIRELDA